MTAAAAAGAYVATTHVSQHAREADHKARKKSEKLRSKKLHRIAEVTGHIGKWYTHVPLALAGAGALALSGRKKAAANLAAASLAAAAISRGLETLEDHRAHREPPPGKKRIKPDAQSYPSNHALETTAVAIAAGTILVREGLAPTSVVAPIGAVASIISGVGRLVLDRHWASDLVGGYAAGTAVGAACAGAYEVMRDGR